MLLVGEAQDGSPPILGRCALVVEGCDELPRHLDAAELLFDLEGEVGDVAVALQPAVDPFPVVRGLRVNLTLESGAHSLEQCGAGVGPVVERGDEELELVRVDDAGARCSR